MGILNRNRHLLWFTLLPVLVLAGSSIGHATLHYTRWTVYPDDTVLLILGFFLEFATLFCLVFLLAGLVLNISPKIERPASFFKGLAGIKEHLEAIFVWSFILALAGMLLDRINRYFYDVFLSHVYGFLISTLNQFPFTLNLNPTTFSEIPGYGGRGLLFCIYPQGFTEALVFFAINLLLFILTAYVVPLIVLEQMTIREAVAGSLALMKKTWAEAVACTVFLAIIVSGVFLTYVLVQAAHGIATPPEILYDRPTGVWLAVGILYYLVLFSVAFVVVTVGGIATLDFFASAKRSQMSGSR